MTEENIAVNGIKEEVSLECRACLQNIEYESEVYYIFQSWVPPWEGMEETIAQDMSKLAQVEISDVDDHSKIVCELCYQKLKNACLFTSLMRQSDQILRQRYSNSLEPDESDRDWPKPIQLDKNVSSLCTDPMEMDIKQEVLSDNENDCTKQEENYNYCIRQEEHQQDLDNMDIKIEPEELIQQQHSEITMNGHHEDYSTEVPLLNGHCESYLGEAVESRVKEEPQSEEDETVTTDLSLECMLCAKTLNSVSGLKAHVIAQHSYKSVRRKASDEPSPLKTTKNKYVCETCRRSFVTSTDLMVHETCHNKSTCYGCGGKFDTFELLLQHRHLCKGASTHDTGRVKTLEDVQRPMRVSRPQLADKSKNASLICLLCGERFTDMYYLKIHREVSHPAPVGQRANDEMEVEALESLFSERA